VQYSLNWSGPDLRRVVPLHQPVVSTPSDPAALDFASARLPSAAYTHKGNAKCGAQICPTICSAVKEIV